MADLYLADQFPPQSASAETPTVKLSAESLSALTGTYRDTRDGVPWTFVVDGDSLAFEQLVPIRTKLQPTAETTFRGTGPLAALVCEFVAPADGKPKQVRVGIAGGTQKVLEPVAFEKPSAEALQEYAGSYYSDEADATLTLTASKERLLFDAPGQPRKSLRPTVHDEFTHSGGVMQFERGADGKIAALRLNSPRIRKLRFARQAD